MIGTRRSVFLWISSSTKKQNCGHAPWSSVGSRQWASVPLDTATFVLLFHCIMIDKCRDHIRIVVPLAVLLVCGFAMLFHASYIDSGMGAAPWGIGWRSTNTASCPCPAGTATLSSSTSPSTPNTAPLTLIERRKLEKNKGATCPPVCSLPAVAVVSLFVRPPPFSLSSLPLTFPTPRIQCVVASFIRRIAFVLHHLTLELSRGLCECASIHQPLAHLPIS